MAIQRSQWEQHGTLVLALLLNVNSPPFYGLLVTLIFILGDARLICIRKEKPGTVVVSGMASDAVIFVQGRSGCY